MTIERKKAPSCPVERRCLHCGARGQGTTGCACLEAFRAAPEGQRWVRDGDPISEAALAAWSRRVKAERANGAKP